MLGFISVFSKFPMIKATTSIKGMYALTKDAIIKLKMPISITNDVQCDKKGCH